MAAEYTRLQEERRRGQFPHSLELEEMRTRLTELERSLHRLEENVTTSQKGLQATLQKVLHGLGASSHTVVQEVPQPAASIDVQDPAAPNLSGTQAWKSIETNSLPLMLDGGGTSRAADDVVVDVAGDIVADVSVDVQVEHDVVNECDVADVVEGHVEEDHTEDVADAFAAKGGLGVEASKSAPPSAKSVPKAALDSVPPEEVHVNLFLILCMVSECVSKLAGFLPQYWAETSRTTSTVTSPLTYADVNCDAQYLYI